MNIIYRVVSDRDPDFGHVAFSCIDWSYKLREPKLVLCDKVLFRNSITKYPLSIKNYAAIALENGELIGAVIWDYEVRGHYGSNGTWVAPSRRRRGIAFNLWCELIRVVKPQKISVCVVTDRGWTIIQKVLLTHPNIMWLIQEDAHRKLRDLRFKNKGIDLYRKEVA